MATIDTYLTSLIEPKNTTAARRNDIGQFIKFLQDNRDLAGKDDVNWAQMRPIDLEAYRAGLGAGPMKESTINRKVSFTRRFVDWLVEIGRIDPDILGTAHRMIAPQPTPRTPATLSGEQLEQLPELAFRSRRESWRRDAAMLALLTTTGCMASELVNLNQIDIEPGSCLIFFVDQHGYRGRAVSVNKDVWKLYIAGYVNWRTYARMPGDHLFANHRDGRLGRAGLWLIVRHYLSFLDADGVDLTGIRYSVARRIIESGGSTTEIAAHFGLCRAAALTYARALNVCR